MGKALKISRYIPSASQARLNLFVSEKRVSLAIEHPREALIRSALFALLAVFIFAYICFVAASIFNIMARREASAASLALQSTITVMESEYFSIKHGMSVLSAGHIGLSPIADTSYVYRPGNAASAAPHPADRMDGNAI